MIRAVGRGIVDKRLTPRPSEDHVKVRVRTLSIMHKVLVANAFVILVGAIAGTLVTIWMTDNHGRESARWLMVPFLTAGVLLSLLATHRVLTAAFRPLAMLEHVTSQVRSGDYDARATLDAIEDPQIASFAASLNQTLDVIGSDRERIRQLADRVISAQEEERKRIARDLHDDTAQVLFANLLQIAAMKNSDDPAARSAAERIEPALVDAIESVRSMAYNLRPPALDDLGLREALDGLTQRFSERIGIPVEFTARGIGGHIDTDVELVLYRLAQEALTNCAKHAHATRIDVTLEIQKDAVTLDIEDNGRGIPDTYDRSARSDGMGLGLFGMQERVDLVNGTVTIDGQRNPGTRISARIPLGEPALSGPAG